MAKFEQTSGRNAMVKKVGNSATINHQAAAQSAQRYAVSPSHGPATMSAKVGSPMGVDKLAAAHAETRSRSSHNDVNRFMSNVNMHHPYSGPSSKSLGNDQELQSTNTSARSRAHTPSGSAGKISGRKVAQVMKAKGRNNPMTENTVNSKVSTGLSDVARRISKGKARK